MKPPVVFLIGLPGSGKSSLARMIASSIGWTSDDTDLWIEYATARSIKQIFSQDGESYFRALERYAIDRLAGSDGYESLENQIRQHDRQALAAQVSSSIDRARAAGGLILATGGGMSCDPHNFDLMFDCGMVVYLKLSLEEIAKRVSHQGDRPLLAPPDNGWLNDEQLLERLRILLSARQIYYEKAHVQVDTGKRSLAEAATDVIIHLKEAQVL